MEQQRLPDQLVEATVDAIRKEFRFWGKRYKMGFATKAECYQGMEISIREGFRKVLGDNGLKLCFCLLVLCPKPHIDRRILLRLRTVTAPDGVFVVPITALKR